MALGGFARAAEPLPPPAQKTISFAKDVKAILAHHCFECHAGGRKKGGLQMVSRELFLKGGESGAVVVPGTSIESALIKRVVSTDPDELMPQKGARLSAEQIGILRAWIDQGLVWDEPAAIDRQKKIDIAPRRPNVAAANGENPIDALLASYFKKNPPSIRNPQSQIRNPVEDPVFARRVYFDLTGLPPSPRQLAEFLADTQPDKRARLVQRALADTSAYAAHWMSFWSDLLRNGTTLAGIDGHANVNISPWLEAALKTNMPYNQFVSELINPKKETEPFLRGVRMRGVIPASQTSEMQAAQNVSQLFLGVQIKCASCHDSFVSRWTLEDAYGLAGIFAEKPIEMIRCEVPTGKIAPLRFIYPELGDIDGKAPRPQRLQQLAAIITKPENGQFTRTIVNRLWGRFFGRAIVEPVDEMENTPWNSDLLDFLASDLAANGHDLKKTMALILTSKAYQMPSVDRSKNTPGENPGNAYVFSGPRVRRLTAEQHIDTLYSMLAIPNRAYKQKNSALLESLGRPDRNTIATTRDSEATTLQALELFNGPNLNKILYEQGAKHLQALLTEKKSSKAAVIEHFYLQALSRAPTPDELDAIEKATPVFSAETAADIVWAITLLPEFQLIR